ncbi:hypothetical protein [Yersinia massiliensis]|uniref:Uncharacterized protein n=1 Tax=Yersinia massiliensis TaxID=419257 RepID=A0ABM6UVI7_9GAMM|nr:hypothetical protein [Yersinia massiliensis]AVX38707.1 hypothetical protein DA391_14115 [Yersinia massiliensis]
MKLSHSPSELERCCKLLDSLDDRERIWLIPRGKIRNLSYTRPGLISPFEAIDLIKSDDDLNEYLLAVYEGIDEYISPEQLQLCNSIWSEIISDRSISKSMNVVGITIQQVIDPKKHIELKILVRKYIKSEVETDKSKWINILNEKHPGWMDRDHNFSRFENWLLRIIWGYLSGELYKAYGEGKKTLDTYKILTDELLKLSEHSVFTFFSLSNLGGAEKNSLERMGENASLMSDFILTSRKDETLKERALAVEILKLFLMYAKKSHVRGAQIFLNAEFVENYIDRKTIQRCWDMVKKLKMDKVYGF